MVKKNIVYHKGEDTIKVEIRDVTQRILYRATYKINSKGDLFNLLSALEKFTPYTIRQIIDKDKWI